MTKIIFFDIDDTISRKGAMLAHHIETLTKLSQTDIKLVIATSHDARGCNGEIMVDSFGKIEEFDQADIDRREVVLVKQ